MPGGKKARQKDLRVKAYSAGKLRGFECNGDFSPLEVHLPLSALYANSAESSDARPQKPVPKSAAMSKTEQRRLIILQHNWFRSAAIED